MDTQGQKTQLEAIGQAISKRRMQSGMTQVQVAKALGIGKEALSRIERGTVVPNIVRLIELAEVYDCSLGELLCEVRVRPEEQAKRIAELLSELDEADRQLVVDMVEQLTGHMARGRSAGE